MSANVFMLVGGGTGGHITPNLAVARWLKETQPDCRIVYVLEKGARFGNFLDGQTDIDEVRTISAGKFRRYNGESWLRRLFDIKTNLLNIRDAFRTLAGLLQARRLLKQEKPMSIFIKGSFVGLPVGLAAAWLHIPFVTHDSDVLPGLSNRLIGRWARYHATGMPAEFYPYPPEKTKYTGIPLSAKYRLVDAELQASYRQQLNIAADAQVLLIVGGSNGAQTINRAVVAIVEPLLAANPKLLVIHQTGPQVAYAQPPHNSRLRVVELIPAEDMAAYSGAADLIVARAGATTIAEFAAQAKACLIVPNPRLTGGHQVKNAEALLKLDAVEVITEADLENPESLQARIEQLLAAPDRRHELAQHLWQQARYNGGRDIAELLVRISGGSIDRV